MLPVLTDFSFPTNSPTWLSGVFYNVKPRGVELCGRYWTGKSARLCRKWTYQESYTCGEMHGWNELTTPNIDYSKSMKNWERLIIAWIYWKLCNHTAFHVLLLECAPRNAEETEDEGEVEQIPATDTISGKPACCSYKDISGISQFWPDKWTVTEILRKFRKLLAATWYI